MDNLVLTRKRLGQVHVAAGTDVFDLVGNTPLVPLRRVAADVLPVEVYAKAEWFNPSGSVKDRPAREIILAAEREGKLSPEVALLDATSGNMGIAYAMLCASRGYRARLVIPQNASPERVKILRAYGAESGLFQPARKHRRGDPPGTRNRCERIRSDTFTPTSTAIRPTGRRTIARRVWKCGSKPTGA